jgi:hypothetical protein
MNGRREAFTLVECVIVSGLLVFVAMLLSATWSGLGRPIADNITRGRLTQEANLAAASLARDLEGSLSNPEGRLGTKQQARFVGRMQPNHSQLWLCFDGGDTPNGVADWGPPDTVIVYEVDSNKLIRWDQKLNTNFVVAQNVDNMQVQDLGDSVQIMLTFKYRDLIQTYTLIARDP